MQSVMLNTHASTTSLVYWDYVWHCHCHCICNCWPSAARHSDHQYNAAMQQRDIPTKQPFCLQQQASI